MRFFTDAVKRALLGASFALLATLTSGAVSIAAALPAGLTEATSVEGITEYRLESNGLRILLAPDDSKPTTTVNMTYLVGSRHENYGETGMAHLLEHLLFKGTPTHPNALAEFSKRGLQANGSTSTDRTNYFASFAVNPDTLSWYLGWQADAMVNSKIAREDLDTEMTVVRNEMENGENNPFQTLWQKMLGVAFQWHNYGKTPIGARSDVENVDIAQLQAFYRLYYQPDNAVLIVSGKFDPTATLEAIVKTFSVIPKPSRKLPPEYTIEPVQDGERSVILRRTGGSPLVAAMYHVPPSSSSDFAALDLASMIIADTPSGRLYKALVPTKLATSVLGFTMDEFAPGIVMFGATLQPGMDQKKSLQTLTQAIEGISKQPFTQLELDRVRNQWLTSWNQGFSDAQKIGVALSEAIAIGDWRMLFVQRDRIRAVKLPDVQRVATEYLLAANRTEGQYIPTVKPVRAPLQSIPDIAKELQNYKGEASVKQAEAFDPDPANIDNRTLRKTLTLPNGAVKLAMLKKESRGERVRARIEINFGSVDTLKGQRLASLATADLLMRGTDKLTRQQISDKIDALQAEVSVSGSGTYVILSLSTTRPHIDALVSLMLDVVRNANFSPDQVEEYQRATITSLKSAMTEPTSIANRMLARHDNPYAKDDIRYTPTFEESLSAVESLKREALVSFHKKFYGTGEVAISIVGDFDPQSFETTISMGLQGWKKAPSYTRIPQPYREVKATQMEAITPDKANAFYLAKMPLALQDTNADYPALALVNFMLGSSETSRLWMRVREKEGLSYNVRSTFSASAFEPSASWSIYAIFAPQNRLKVETAIKEELDRLVKEGFTDDEVNDGVKALLNYRKLSRAQDGTLVSTWLDYLETNRSFKWAAEMDQKLSQLTAESVNTAIKQYLKPEGFSSVAAGDFKKQ
jgi:zinc protease